MRETGGFVVGPWLTAFEEVGEVVVTGRRRENGKGKSVPEVKSTKFGVSGGKEAKERSETHLTEVVEQVHVFKIPRRHQVSSRARVGDLWFFHRQLVAGYDASCRLLSKGHRDCQAEERVVDPRSKESCKRDERVSTT